MITLTITARDAAHARAILDAVARLDAPELVEWLVSPDGSGAPTGHTHRELADAHRAGLLVAAVTPRGLTFTQRALDDYRAARAARRKRKRQATAEPVDITEHRIRSLTRAGITVGR